MRFYYYHHYDVGVGVGDEDDYYSILRLIDHSFINHLLFQRSFCPFLFISPTICSTISQGRLVFSPVHVFLSVTLLNIQHYSFLRYLYISYFRYVYLYKTTHLFNASMKTSSTHFIIYFWFLAYN